MKFQYKLLIVLAALVLIIGTSTIIFTSIIVKRGLAQSLIAREKIGLELLKHRLFPYLANRDYDKAIEILFDEKAIKKEMIHYIAVYDTRGNILVHTFLHEIAEQAKRRIPGARGDFSINETSMDDIPVIEMSIMIKEGAYEIGNLCVGYKKEYIKNIVAQINRAIVIIILILTALSIILSYFMSGYIVKPIRKLSNGAEEVSKGNLNFRIEIDSKDEIGAFAASFNKMTRDLQRITVSKNYVDNIIESMINTLIVVSADGKITRANAAACALLGYEEKELVNGPIEMIFERQASTESPPFHKALTDGPISNIEKIYVSRTGKKVPVIFSSSVIHDADNGFQGVVCVAQDITERKQTEEQLRSYSRELEQINEELKNFAYIVSHDLRAPLVNIKGFSDELSHAVNEFKSFLEKYMDRFDEGEKRKTEELLKKNIPEALGFIGSSVTRMDTLINSILKLSRLGRSELKPEPVHTEELVHTLLGSLAHQIDMRHAEITTGPLPELIIDRTAAEQIFGNMLDNALKYLEPSRPGKVEITAEQNAGEVTFTIRDNGRGIAEKDTQKVFELFRRVGKQDVPGEGMGLTYVKTLVRRLGGRIWCESEPGVGTTFSFTVPQRPCA